jgi:lipopolysaccharide/colanic/teichoic acid biosynthesis glycosyltransferase
VRPLELVENTELLPGYRRLGLTGLWHVSGRNGLTFEE